MFKHLLVPLDGSKLAESSLPAASYLAQVMGASITLIHIVEHDAPREVHRDRHLTNPDEAYAYLAEIAKSAFPADAKVEQHVHTTEVKDVVSSIVDHSVELRPDLIVMCTHGNSGPRDWLFGSIAQQVISLGDTPVLLIPPKPGIGESFNCRQMLIPLDGTPEHEQGLSAAVGLAEACGASIYLLMVIPTLGTLGGERAATGRMLPGAMSAVLDLEEQGGKEYLEQILDRLQRSGLVFTAEVKRGEPVETIVETARRQSVDLIVLGTHGKTGTDAFWSGSATPKVFSRSHMPLLLVPVREEGSAA
jgi:nucleotide-binding universal stress UspA family protein